MSASRTAAGTVTRRALSLLSGVLLAMLLASPAAAHAELATADPADGSTVTGSPARITLTFTEALSDRSFFNLKGAGGVLVGKGVPDPADSTALVLEPPSLAAGAYTIEWQAAALDGHIEKGRTTFTVVPAPSPTPATTRSPAPTAVPTAGATSGPSVAPSSTPVGTPAATPADVAPASSATDVVVPIAAGLLLVGGLAFLLLRRSRSA